METDVDSNLPSTLGSFSYDPAPESAAIARLQSSYGLFINGAFTAPENHAQFATVNPATGHVLATVAQASDADVDRAVAAARHAYETQWSKTTGAERAKYLFRIARLIQERSRELAVVETLDNGKPIRESRDIDVPLAAAHFFYYAGWADKYEQVLGNVNPVAAPFFNFTVTEPMGIVGIVAPDPAPLLGLISLVAPVITSGNTTVALASEKAPYPAIVLGEMLATSDLPGGVVNLLTGFRKELVPTFATHTHLRAVSAVASADERKAIQLGAADSVKRTRLLKAEERIDWFSADAQHLYAIRDFVEFKTTWHPIGS